MDSLIAPSLTKGAMDGDAFTTYIREVFVSKIQPGTVEICDNLATHKNIEAAKALREHQCWFVYLPPYSPDLYPIEQALLKPKAHLQKIAARSFTDLIKAIRDICNLFTLTVRSRHLVDRIDDESIWL